MKSFKFIDLFCGIGGFHLAMESLGGECVFASDIDDDCRKTYAENYGITPAGDITKIEAKDIPSHDVLCAGFPCQAFSKAGKRLGFEDETKGTLFFDVCRIMEYHKPKYALLENVRNLASHDHGNTWRVIHNRLEDLGYNLLSEPVIFSPHYIGIPQHRERVYIMCARKDIGEVSPFEFDKKKIKPCSIEDILQNDSEISNIEEYRVSKEMGQLIDLWNEFLQNIKVDKLPGFPIWTDRLCELNEEEDLSPYPSWKQNFIHKNNELYLNNKKFIDKWLVRAKKNPLFFGAKAKLEWQAGNVDTPNIWNQIFQLRPSGIRVKVNSYFPALVAIVQTSIIGSRRRYLTPRECARLQSFPDTFMYDVKQAQAYKQFGNAVNVDCVKLFAKHMFGEISDQIHCSNGDAHRLATIASSKTSVRRSKVHEKIRLVKGNAFEPQTFGADGIVAFVNEGFTESSSTYKDFITHNNGEIKIALFQYNNDMNGKPHLEQYVEIVSDALDKLAQEGVKVVAMPPLNGDGGSPKDKLIALENGVALWLDEHLDSSIEKVYITIF